MDQCPRPELCAGHDDDLAEDQPDVHWGWMIRKVLILFRPTDPESLIRYLRSIGKIRWKINKTLTEICEGFIIIIRSFTVR